MADNLLLAQWERYRDRLPVVGPALLFWLSLPLFPAVFIALARGNFINFVTDLSALVLLMASAWCVRQGMKRDTEIDRLGWSRITPIPWKLLGAIGSGIATAACSFFVIRHSELASVAVGVTTMAGVLCSYDLDGLFYRWAQRGPRTHRDREITEALQEAKVKIDNIDAANRHIHNPELKRRIRRIIRQAMEILTSIANDPITLRKARKFLKVYLDGVQRVTEGYARVHQDQRGGELESNFRNVLITIEDTFAEQQKKLLEKDLMDLDIQIEVLSTQLRNEGVM